jgi:hypothetical protein
MRRTVQLSLVAMLSILSLISSAFVCADDFQDDYDRLDGRGKSGKKVNVIEWEGNLEIHVYPGGSTQGLALTIDDSNQNKKVMVIGYRFDSNPREQLIRRNVLSIPIRPGFKVYRDPRSGKEYDKFIVTNTPGGAPLVAYQLESPPTQLYPEGHSSLAKQEESKRDSAREPASGYHAPDSLDQETGRIRPTSW